ncbi:MAG: N-acylneuraminate cytidylyltransferase [Candidatus Peregrinibacteria bacterium Gr01-1014_25]|nr:MAG: N-acylneuraminate cytidylyltransferase [Candidatus Peregrinibacteria bacterium Gr01-1014_25]
MNETVPRTLGVITARGGSRGIPRKNIALLAGKPLIAYTIDAAAQSRLTRCIVSTDDSDIAEMARSLGADVPFLRPAELSTDAAGSIEVMQHAIRWMEERGERFDYAMILQPTSPLRTGADIDACLELAARTNADSVMSMVQIPDFAVQKLKRITEDGRIQPRFADEGQRSAHRDNDPVYKRNTAIYLTRVPVLMRGELFGADSRAYVMPRERSVDVNEPMDMAIAELLLGKTT